MSSLPVAGIVAVDQSVSQMSIHQSTPALGSQSVPSPSSALASTTQVISIIASRLCGSLLRQPAAGCGGEVGERLAADRHGEEDDRAVDDEQRAARQVQRRQQAGEDGQHQGAGDRAEIVAAAAEDRGAADGDRGDRGEEIGVAHAEIGLAGIAGEQHAGERGGEAGERRRSRMVVRAVGTPENSATVALVPSA